MDHLSFVPAVFSQDGNRLIRRIIIFALLSLSTVPVLAQVDTAWVRRYAVPSGSGYTGKKIVADASGNVYVAGSVSFGGTGTDFVTIKRRSSGDTAWVRFYNGPSSAADQAIDIAVDALGNVYVTGSSTDDGSHASYATVKYDSSGNQLWARRVSEAGPMFHILVPVAIGLDAAANVYVSGTKSNLVDGVNNDDIVTVKYDTDGNLVWTKTYSAPGYYVYGTFPPATSPAYKRYPSVDRCRSMKVDAAGNVAIVGSTQPFAFFRDWYPGSDFLTLTYPSGTTASGGPSQIAREEEGNPGVTSTHEIQAGSPKKIQQGRCGTSAAKLTSLLGVPTRPSGFQTSKTTTNFVIHYDTAGLRATTHLFADKAAVIAEHSWSVEITALGWQAPPNDSPLGGDGRFDIYLDSLIGQGGTFAITYPEAPPNTGGTSFIRLNLNYSHGWSDTTLSVTIAHEFNHASQFSYSNGPVSEFWWDENTAAYMEDIVYDSLNDYLRYFKPDGTDDPLNDPEDPITTFNGKYEYGGMLWPTFLSDFYSPSFPRTVYEHIAATSYTGNALSHIAYVLQTSYGSDLPEALREYGVWRFFTGSRADTAGHFKESNTFPTSWVLRRHSVYPASGNQGGGAIAPDCRGGTAYIVFSNAGGSTLNVSLNGQNTVGPDDSVFVATLVGYSPSGVTELPYDLDPNSDGSQSLSFPGYDSLALVVTAGHWTSGNADMAYTYTAGQTAGQWVQTYDDPYTPNASSPLPDLDAGSDVTFDPQGNIIVTGTSSSPAPSANMTTIKYTSGGTRKWIARQSVMPSGSARKIASDNGGNIIVLGTSMPASPSDADYLTVKYDSTGTKLWSRSFGGAREINDTPYDLKTDAEGNIYIAGSAWNRLPPGSPILAGVTLRYGPTGDSVWARLDDLDTVSGGELVSVALDPDQNVIVTGTSGENTVTIKYSQRDIQLVSILSPLGIVQAGDAIVPKARIANHGSVSASFNVSMTIGPSYNQTVGVSNLKPDSTRDITFPVWSVTHTAGLFAVTATANLAGDYNNGNNLSAGSVTVTASTDTVTTIIIPGTHAWNMISLPRIVSDRSKNALFPSAATSAFSYQGGYVVAETLNYQMGYWLRFAHAESLSITGGARTLDTFRLSSGWNLIGSLSASVPVNSLIDIPTGTVVSKYFTYNGSYVVADSIKPANAYWVKTSDSAMIILATPGGAKSAVKKPDGVKLSERYSSITFFGESGNGQMLYFDERPTSSETGRSYVMPPPAPDGSFDARFASGRMVDFFEQKSEIPVIFTTDRSPVYLRWKLQKNLQDRVVLQVGGTNIPLDSESSTISLPPSPGILRLLLTNTYHDIQPKVFTLRQNFPNPFNPSTIIRFELPKESVVDLRIFNTIGQEVKTIFHQKIMGGGVYSAVFDGSTLPSGLYFYRLSATTTSGRDLSFTEVRKMELVK
jgi:hypothetical protein